MKIERIHIKNFGIVSDVDIDLSDERAKLVFINGQNGRGKTTFQSALKWCFYQIMPPEEKFLSKFARDNANVNTQIIASVSVRILLDERDLVAEIERNQVFQKLPDGHAKKVGTSSLVVKTRKMNDPAAMTVVLPNPEVWIEQYFPSRLVDFFLFDGELMSTFYKKDSSVKGAIEDAIREIAGVDLFDGISQNLTKVETTLNNRVAKLTGKGTEAVAEEFSRQQALAGQIFAELNEVKSRLSSKRARRTEVRSLLADSAHVSVSASQLEDLDKSIETLEEELRLEENNFNKLLLKSGTFSLLATSAQELEKQVELAKSEDRLPPPFEPSRIKYLLDNNKCICGCELEKNSEQTKRLEKLIEKYQVASHVGRILDTTSRDFEKSQSVFLGEKTTIERINKNIAKLARQIGEAKDKRKSLLIGLQGHDVDNIRILSKESVLLDDEIEKLVGEQASLELQGTNAAASLDRLNEELNKASAGNLEAQELHKQALKTREVANAARKIHELAVTRVRLDLVKAINPRFSQVKKGNFFTEINENFQVLTTDANGDVVELSQGEQMAKAYIFSGALRDVLNLGFPLIVDTPMGRLSNDFRDYLEKFLISFLSAEVNENKRQVIFLMTDSEYTPYTKEAFEKIHPIEAYLAYVEGQEGNVSKLGFGIDPNWLHFAYWKDWAKKQKGVKS